jgi:hypothetical protein
MILEGKISENLTTRAVSSSLFCSFLFPFYDPRQQDVKLPSGSDSRNIERNGLKGRGHVKNPDFWFFFFSLSDFSFYFFSLCPAPR